MKKITRSFIKKLLPERQKRGDKRSAGVLLCVCGSNLYPGAALLSTAAACRSGAGLVYLASDKEVCRASVLKTPECVCLPFEDGQSGKDLILKKLPLVSAVLFGCGTGQTGEKADILKAVLKASCVPVIIDADGLNILSSCPDILKDAACPVILTPHGRELSRLLSGASCESAASFAEKYGVTLVCKGAETRVYEWDAEYLLNAPCSALSKGGSGDVLAGITASLAAQGASPLAAALCGVYIHSRAGRLLAGKLSAYSALPSDLIAVLPRVFKRLSR